MSDSDSSSTTRPTKRTWLLNCALNHLHEWEVQNEDRFFEAIRDDYNENYVVIGDEEGEMKTPPRRLFNEWIDQHEKSVSQEDMGTCQWPGMSDAQILDRLSIRRMDLLEEKELISSSRNEKQFDKRTRTESTDKTARETNRANASVEAQGSYTTPGRIPTSEPRAEVGLDPNVESLADGAEDVGPDAQQMSPSNGTAGPRKRKRKQESEQELRIKCLKALTKAFETDCQDSVALSTLDKKMSTMEQKFTERMIGISGRISNLSKFIETVENRVAIMDETIVEMDTMLSEVFDLTTHTDGLLDELEDPIIATAKRLAIMDKRLAGMDKRIEKQFADMTDKIMFEVKNHISRLVDGLDHNISTK